MPGPTSLSSPPRAQDIWCKELGHARKLLKALAPPRASADAAGPASASTSAGAGPAPAAAHGHGAELGSHAPLPGAAATATAAAAAAAATPASMHGGAEALAGGDSGTVGPSASGSSRRGQGQGQARPLALLAAPPSSLWVGPLQSLTCLHLPTCDLVSGGALAMARHLPNLRSLAGEITLLQPAT